MRILKIQLDNLQIKERVRIRSERIKNQRMPKRQHHNPINKASLPQIQTRMGTTIRRRKSVPIARNWVMKSMSVIIKRLMS